MQSEQSRRSIVLSNYKDAYEYVNPRVEFTKLDEAIILPNKPTSAMTSTLPEEDSKTAKIKQRLMSNGHIKEEKRSFLNFSRENLSVSHSDLEQGFNRSRQRPSRNMILNVSALIISILCLGLVSWKLNSNAREIEQLKRNVNNLKRFLELDLINEIKTLKELYAESSEDNDPGEADIDNADYDSNYDDSTSHDYTDNPRTLLTYGSRSVDFLKTTSVPTSMDPHKAIVKNKQENYKNIEERLEEKRTSLNREKIGDANSTEHQHDITTRNTSANTGYIKESIKLKRSVSDHTVTDDSLMNTSNYHHAGRYPTKKTLRNMSKTHPYTNNKSHTNNTEIALLEHTNSTPHSPKKYHTHARLETFPSMHDDQLSEAIIQPNSRMSDNLESVSGDGVNWRNRDIKEIEIHKSVQVYAIHYGADSALFTAEDEHTGNGRARHNHDIFKAWRPSGWVADLDMNRHFTLATSGTLTVHEPGLYLAYAQIHYVDVHDENGFRLLVNNQSILQCMVYSPGKGHKSRSCFSAQVTVLQAGDHLVLKDIGSARYTLFQRDKSFFGLVKLGELRQQQKHQTQQLTHH
ncbi:protein eiger isoform X2 [Cataglyphis hispanica]|uniref:protein eiger isoform X2 n=1 Tax=Cataglyphis hispanica TaxID=1086592 RepID=UPI00218086C5|nr:protein eiger isoform X2 [Cataglyphis hispanica]